MDKLFTYLRDEGKMQKNYFLLALVFVVGLVFQDMSKFPMTAALSLSSFFVLISGNWPEKWSRLKSKPVILLLIAYYLFHIVGVFYSDDMKFASRTVSLKISILLFGVVWSVVKLTTDQIKKVLLTYVLACFLASFIDLFSALLRYLETGDLTNFLYNKLSIVFPNKKHYLSMYYAFAAFITMFFAIRPLQWMKSRVLFIIASLWFTNMVLLLGARAQLLAMLIVGPILIIQIAKEKYASWKIWTGAVGFFIFLSVVILVNPITRPKVIESYDELNELFNPEGKKTTNPRVYIWDYAMDQIMEQSVIWGAGTGDAVNELQVRMYDCEVQFWIVDKYYLLRDKKLNYHNQFLESLATLGISSILLLLAVLLWPLIKYFSQSKIFLMFLLLITLSFMTESILERQAGVLFFAFFYPFLLQRKII